MYVTTAATSVFDSACANGGMPYVWSDTYGARLGVLRRDDPYGDIRWFDIDPCYVFHTLNSYEENEGRSLVLLGMRYPSLRDGVTVATAAHLWRWTIDLTTGAISEEQLDDHPGEFPRIDDRLAGLPADFGHASVAEQNQVFANAIAAGGQSNWAPYDGC